MEYSANMSTATYRRTISKLTIILFVTFISLEGVSWELLRVYSIPVKQNIIFGAKNGRDDSFSLKVNDDGAYSERGTQGEFYADSAGRVFSKDKPENVVRIICLGASETYGVGADKNHSYPALLESILNASIGGLCGLKFEVINAGFMGYHSWHSRVLLLKELLKFQPDYVSIMQGPNDLLSAVMISNKDQFLREIDDIVNVVERSPGWLEKTLSRVDPYLAHTVASYRVAKKAADILLHINDAGLSVEEKLEIFGYAGNVRKIVELGYVNEYCTIVLNYPWAVKLGRGVKGEDGNTSKGMVALYEKGREFFDKKNGELLSMKGVILVDALRGFDQRIEQSNGRLVDRLYHDEVHFTKYGNSIIARAMIDSLLGDPGFRAKICAFDPYSLDSIFTLYHPHLFFTNGWPDDTHLSQNYLIEATHNILSREEGPPGWMVSEASDKASPGYVILKNFGSVRLQPMESNGIFNSFFYPRVASARDNVRVKDSDGNTLFHLTGTNMKSAWTGVSEKYGFNIPVSFQGKTIVIELSGDAQVWHSGKGIVFTNDTKHPGY